jgi:hypothetical protein
MRHYIRYGLDGDLVGCDTCTEGWSPDADPRDPNTTDRVAQGLRKRREEMNPTFSGWAAYDCPCSRTVVSCLCPYNLLPNHYYNGVVIFPKPSLAIEVDGNLIEQDSLTSTPGSTLQITLHAATLDDHIVELVNTSGLVTLMDGPKELVFNGGVSSAAQLTVPPQGVSGTIRGKSKYVREFCLTITGWV